MLAKRKYGKLIPTQTALDNLKINVHKISMADYEQHHYDKDLLAQAGKYLNLLFFHIIWHIKLFKINGYLLQLICGDKNMENVPIAKIVLYKNESV